MKLRHVLLGMFAIAATVACDPVEPEVTPELNVNKTEASVAAEGGSVAVQVTANVDWTAAADKDWVSVDPASGKGNATVTLTVAPNETEEARTANVTVKADKLSKTVKITQAGKTADPTPEPEPEPELKVSDWAVVGSFTGEGWGWDPGAGIPLYILNDEYFVVYGLELPAEAQFKFLQGGAWGGAEVGADRTSVEPNTIQQKGGSNIYLAAGGTYDIYLSADATKYYIMSVGKTPSEATEPAAAEVTFTVTGTLQNDNWNNMASAGLMTKEGSYYVAKNVPFVTAATLYGGADQIEFKICNTGSWDGAYGAAAEGTNAANAEIAVAVDGGNIAVVAPEGAYDVYFDKENGKAWVMTPGYKPGDEIPGGDQPETPAMPEIPADLVAQTIWEGTFESGSWGGMQDLAYGKYDWSVRRPGQYLKFYCGPTDPASQWLMGLRLAATDGWRPVDNLPEFYYQPEGGIVVVELTQELIDLLVQNNGLVVQGDNITLTKIELYRENTGGQESDTINNILVNSDFEDGATGWMGWWNPTYTQAMGEGRNGGNAMELTLGACSALWDAQLLQDIAALEAGVTYAYEFYAKTDSAPLQVQMCAQNPTPPDYPGLYVFAYHDAGTEWTACTGEFVYDGNPASITRIGIQFGKADAVGTKLWIDDFKFGPKK